MLLIIKHTLGDILIRGFNLKNVFAPSMREQVRWQQVVVTVKT